LPFLDPPPPRCDHFSYPSLGLPAPHFPDDVPTPNPPEALRLVLLLLSYFVSLSSIWDFFPLRPGEKILSFSLFFGFFDSSRFPPLFWLGFYVPLMCFSFLSLFFGFVAQKTNPVDQVNLIHPVGFCLSCSQTFFPLDPRAHSRLQLSGNDSCPMVLVPPWTPIFFYSASRFVPCPLDFLFPFSGPPPPFGPRCCFSLPKPVSTFRFYHFRFILFGVVLNKNIVPLYPPCSSSWDLCVK